MRNIAKALLKITEQKDHLKEINIKNLRDAILKLIGINNRDWDVEDQKIGKKPIEYRRYGDYKAHGDAIGKHGLCLKIRRTSKGRFVELSPENLKICQGFLNGKSVLVSGLRADQGNETEKIVKMLS